MLPRLTGVVGHLCENFDCKVIEVNGEYFIASWGAVTVSLLKRYIEQQDSLSGERATSR
ncbi:MAG: hypothetical protein P3X23_009750 [Thermosynechococcus sp. Uc]|uniref:hypothetical protein n=1 Tax=Thermosynechococcus sp. Uc TaxID=3034853 RepID=UPI0019E2BC13|nr:hypothetical protein [Thermosynechococcus sp. Uc]MDM7327381.1 hypothetical protein [Thermosynechococcus sp. Uc]HIK26335.1 hypothetical protein [Thermosynechococcus sp. M46_R2017_013]